MSRPIIMTEAMKSQAQEEFIAILNNTKMSDGKLSYNKSFKCEDSKAVVWIEAEAYKKILALVTEFTDEVGWHSTVSRSIKNEFIIEDIFVYPQEVTGSTVNTDQEAYSQWLYELDNDTFNKIRMQGHSHVKMGVSPSGVDDRHRQQILDQLEPDMFYIFMIWNKSLSIHTLIYDMEQNILYEDKDIEVKLIGGEDTDAFIADAKEKVRKKSFSSKQNSRGPEKKQEEVKFDSDLAMYGYYPYGEMVVPWELR